jgi:hypothetical protein
LEIARSAARLPLNAFKATGMSSATTSTSAPASDFAAASNAVVRQLEPAKQLRDQSTAVPAANARNES